MSGFQSDPGSQSPFSAISALRSRIALATHSPLGAGRFWASHRDASHRDASRRAARHAQHARHSAEAAGFEPRPAAESKAQLCAATAPGAASRPVSGSEKSRIRSEAPLRAEGLSGGCGIRTRGTGLPPTCFQDKLLRPLGQTSVEELSRVRRCFPLRGRELRGRARTDRAGRRPIPIHRCGPSPGPPQP